MIRFSGRSLHVQEASASFGGRSDYGGSHHGFGSSGRHPGSRSGYLRLRSCGDRGDVGQRCGDGGFAELLLCCMAQDSDRGSADLRRVLRVEHYPSGR